jgi:hypothetical protein
MLEENVMNIYGSSVAAVTTPKFYAIKGKWIWDDTNEAWEDITTATINSDNELSKDAIPDGTDTIGYAVGLDNLPVGGFDLVLLDDTEYVTGLRVYKTPHGVVRPIEELQN